MEDVKKDILEVRKYLMIRFPFFYSVVANVPIYLSRRVPTAATNGKRILVNPDYWKRLDKREKPSLLLHEILHVALRHIDKTREKKYKGTWNYATDVLINEFIKSLGMVLPKGGIDAEWFCKVTRGEILPDKVIGKSADELYYILLKYIKEDKTIDIIVDGSGSSSEDEGEKEGGEGEDKGDERKDGSGEDGGEVPVVEVDESKLPTPEDVKAATAIAKSVGTVPGNSLRIIESLTKPKINWKRILRSEVITGLSSKVISTWVRINRKLPNVFPGHRRHGDNMPKKVYVLIDVSGSISPETFKEFMSEVASIMNSTKATAVVIFWDATVQGVYTVRNARELLKVEPRGGGGTVIDDALLKVLRLMDRRERNVVVIFTDGMLYLNNKELPKMVKQRANKVIYVYTEEVPKEFDDWGKIRLS